MWLAILLVLEPVTFCEQARASLLEDEVHMAQLFPLFQLGANNNRLIYDKAILDQDQAVLIQINKTTQLTHRFLSIHEWLLF